jgi:16S rRNA (adenine(1408)-N(1))-methyltransferase
VAVPLDNSTSTSFDNLLSLTSGGVIIDIGTGDGRFVYQSARENPTKFYIGIDANAKPLAKISMKATRKVAKGGTANALFIQAAVEDLPGELTEVADEIHIHFPWGSLLRAVAIGDLEVLRGLRRIMVVGGLLEVVIGVDAERDRREIERLQLPPLTLDHISSVLAPKYAASGFKITEKGNVAAHEWPHLRSSWARRLRGNDQRRVVYFIAEAQEWIHE